jgi:hypothetical protein
MHVLATRAPSLHLHNDLMIPHTHNAMASLNTRLVAGGQNQRSPSIAIKKGRPDPKAEADRVELANAVREFDWATWRLYDRIVSHRQRNQALQVWYRDSYVSTDDERGFSRIGDQSNVQPEQMQQTEASSSSSMADDGIFVMDL